MQSTRPSSSYIVFGRPLREELVTLIIEGSQKNCWESCSVGGFTLGLAMWNAQHIDRNSVSDSSL